MQPVDVAAIHSWSSDFGAPRKGVCSQWVQVPPGNWSLQPVALGAVAVAGDRALGHFRQLSCPFEVIGFESERGKGMWGGWGDYVLDV